MRQRRRSLEDGVRPQCDRRPAGQFEWCLTFEAFRLETKWKHYLIASGDRPRTDLWQSNSFKRTLQRRPPSSFPAKKLQPPQALQPKQSSVADRTAAKHPPAIIERELKIGKIRVVGLIRNEDAHCVVDLNNAPALRIGMADKAPATLWNRQIRSDIYDSRVIYIRIQMCGEIQMDAQNWCSLRAAMRSRSYWPN